MTDLISRAELFNRLATIAAPPEANDLKAKIYQVIQEMPAASCMNVEAKIPKALSEGLKRNGWTLCSEGLPEMKHMKLEYPEVDYWTSDYVLVTGRSEEWQEGDPRLYVAHFEVDGPQRKYWIDNFGNTIYDVTAWMPLPELWRRNCL